MMSSHAETEGMEEIAIVGMACRFPGAKNLDEFWENLKNGVEAYTEFSDAELLAAGVAPETLQDPNYVKGGYILADVDQFDASFFGFSPRQAQLTDPQQRLFLECAWEALENASVDVTTTNKIVGVYAGAAMNRYLLAYRDVLTAMDPSANHLQRLIGNDKDYLATQTAYQLDLRGPAINAQTACSTGLVLVHMASQSLLNYECDLALVGSTTLYIPQNVGYYYQENGIFSPDGHCRTFDAEGRGTIFGNGVAAVVLKRLSEAVADGDHIWAVIKGAAVNNDGAHKVGFTAPSADGQARVIAEAQAVAGVTPDSISYIEAHGTATAIGDPIELAALTTVFMADGALDEGTCALGAVKTNVGHLEVAAGMAGVIKTALALYHQQIPPSLHFKTPNPNFSLAGTPFYVNTELADWTTDALPRRAGISSFGIGGTNAHVIMEEAPVRPTATTEPARPCQLLTLSAKSEAARRALAERYLTFLGGVTPTALGDVCYTSHVGRAAFDYRLTIAGATPQVMQERLAAFLATTNANRSTGVAQGQRAAKALVAFLFTGQGAQYVGMGHQLYETEPTFRAALDQCDKLLRPYLGASILQVLYPDLKVSGQNGQVKSQDRSTEAHERPKSKIDETTYTQPALFALEYALAKVWQTWGVQPALLIGHSVGELVAACVAGVFSLEDGLKLVAARARLMGALPQDGAMVSLLAQAPNGAAFEAQVRKAITSYSQTVSIAAINGPDSIVISGQCEAVLAVAEQLAATGVKTRRLTVSHAFHSPLMEPMLEEFAKVAQTITYHPPQLPLVSNVTGKLAADAVTRWQYWVRHVREAVCFADGINTLQEQGIAIFLEIGPKPTLLGMAQSIYDFGDQGRTFTIYETDSSNGPAFENPKSKIVNPTMLPSLREGQPDCEQMLTSLGELYVRGAKVDWTNFDQPTGSFEAPRKMVLPAYAFQRERYWPKGAPYPLRKKPEIAALRPLIDQKMRLPRQKQTIFEKTFSVDALPFLAEHQVYGEVVAPAASYLSLALSGAELLWPNATYEIQDVIIPQALTLFAGATRTVQLITEAQGQSSHTASFQIISFPPEDDAEALLHVTGRLRRATATAPALSLYELQARCATPVLLDPFYAAIQADQIELGPTFQWVTALWHSATGEALARLQMPAAAPSVEGYPLFPGLLDGCFQVVRAAMLGIVSPEQTRANETRLPFAVEALTLYGPTDHQALWCHVKRRHETDDTEWNIEIFTESGQMVAQLTGFQLRAAPAAAIHAGAPGARLRIDWLYGIDWQPLPLPVASPTPTRPDCWLLVGAAAGLQETLVDQLQRTGAPVRQALGLDQCEAAAIHKVIAALAAQYRSVGVIYLADNAEAAPLESIPQLTVDLYGGLLHLTQALVATPLAARLWVVTQGCQAVTAASQEQPPVAAAAGALWGLVRTINQEEPGLQAVCIDVDASQPSAQQAALLQQEFLAGFASEASEAQVAYRQGVRYGARLAQRSPATLLDKQPLTLAGNATYLITGGVGALGLQVAQQLVAAGAKHLVLVARRGVTTDAQRASLAQLTEAGAEVEIIAADIADRAQVQAMIARCLAIAPLRGIVHTAGALADGILQEQTLTDVEAVMQPKVNGAWHLHTLTQGLELDFFVCFSSVVALFGALGQSNYAAANAFMDTLMQKRQQAGLPGLSINWGPWAEVGMAARLDAAQQARWSATGIEQIKPEQARQLLAALLASPATGGQVGVMPLDWKKFRQPSAQSAQANFFERFKRVEPEKQPRPAEEQFATRLAAAAETEYQSLLTAYLQKEIRSLLHLAELPPPHQRLLALGVDSLMAVELRTTVRTALQVHLPMTAFIDSSLEQLAALIAEQLLLARMQQRTPPQTDASTLLVTQPEMSLEEFVL